MILLEPERDFWNGETQGNRVFDALHELGILQRGRRCSNSEVFDLIRNFFYRKNFMGDTKYYLVSCSALKCSGFKRIFDLN